LPNPAARAVAVDITAPAAAVARILRLDCIAFAPVEKIARSYHQTFKLAT
jgi:hypothetical protein